MVERTFSDSRLFCVDATEKRGWLEIRGKNSFAISERVSQWPPNEGRTNRSRRNSAVALAAKAAGALAEDYDGDYSVDEQLDSIGRNQAEFA